jgi:hypothetical protein
MRRALLAAIGLTLAAAAPAGAGWSRPQIIPVPTDAALAVASGPGGEAAVAWATRGSGSSLTVRVAVRNADGDTTTRRVWSDRGVRLAGLTVAVGAHAEATVAWITARSTSSPGTVRAAHGRRTGRWERARTVGRGQAAPRLAIRPDGEVLLVWATAEVEGRGGTGRAWRSPGEHFGEARALSHPRPVWTPTAPLGAAIPMFDNRGAAYVFGSCDGLIRRSAPGERRMGASIDVAQGRVLGLDLAVTGRGHALAAWVPSACTGDIGGEGSRPGPVLARALRADGTLDPVQRVSPADAQAQRVAVVAAPTGGGTVSWTGLTAGSSFLVPISTAAIPATVGPLGPFVPLVANAAGDVASVGTSSLLTGSGAPYVPGAAVQDGLTIRSAGRPDQAAPARAGWFALARPGGRTAAFVWFADPARRGGPLSLSIWRRDRTGNP